MKLPPGVLTLELARACRDGALSFVNDSARWGKVELGRWVSDTFLPLAGHVATEPSARWPVPRLEDIDARLIERITRSARAEVLETLAHEGSRSASFVLRALIAGTVVRCEDAQGRLAWAPTAGASRLADRVLALFAVDYLARPEDFEDQLLVCRACELVSFGPSGCLHAHPPLRPPSPRLPTHPPFDA